MNAPHWSKPLTVEEMYGDWDWDAAVDLVDQSLNPRTSRSIFDTVESLGVGPTDVVLDIGGRDGTHALLMAERFGCRVVAVDPADGNLAEGDRNISGSEHGHLVEIKPGTIEQIPAEDGRFSLVFSRDMMNHVIDIDRGLAECHRVLRPGGAMVVHLVTATELMEPKEAARLFSDLATVPERMSAPGFEAAVAAAGFSVESLDVVGSEWYEASQEAGTVPNYALQLSRLNRNRESYLERMGEVVYRSVYGNALWGVYMLIGKLETRLYVLRRGD